MPKLPSTKNARPLRVEFIGLPGAGKTTMYRGLTARLRSLGVNAMKIETAALEATRKRLDQKPVTPGKRYRDKMLHFLGTRLLKPVFPYSKPQLNAGNEFIAANCRLIDFLINRSPLGNLTAKERTDVISLLQETFSNYQITRNLFPPPEILISDESFCHRAIAIWGRKEDYTPSETKIDEYFSLIPLPHALIVVNADIEKCEQRMSSRSYPKIINDDARQARLNRLLHIQNLIGGFVAGLEKKGVALFFIDNSSNSDGQLPAAVADGITALSTACYPQP